MIDSKRFGSRTDGGQLNPDPNAQIADQLRALYVSVQEETIPDRFMDLLDKLEAAEMRAAQPSTGGRS